MTWNLRKPNVILDVRPIREWDSRPGRPVAGLSPIARAIHRAYRARECAKVAVVIVTGVVSGCALSPDSIRPEIEHMSHISQHFTSEPTHYGANLATVMAHWDVRKIAYMEIGEGIVLDHPSGCVACGDAGYGEIIGPREQFIARMGLIIPLR